MAKNRIFLVLDIILLVAVGVSLAGGGGGSRAPSQATSRATASQRLDTGPPGLPLYCAGFLTHDQQGNIYVTDSDQGQQNSHRARIVKLSPTGTLLATWGKTGSAPGELNIPDGVAVDAQGNVYVSDLNNFRIQKFSSTGTLLAVFGNTGSSTQRLRNPAGIDMMPRAMSMLQIH
jgi:NHL repeat